MPHDVSSGDKHPTATANNKVRLRARNGLEPESLRQGRLGDGTVCVAGMLEIEPVLIELSRYDLGELAVDALANER